jgi:hypothetical protein
MITGSGALAPAGRNTLTVSPSATEMISLSVPGTSISGV